MKRLSSPIQTIKSNYSVVIIGSGYGGGISASRLARAGQNVCVLERGREFLPGEFPDTLAQALDTFITSHEGLSDKAHIEFKFEFRLEI